MEPTDTELTVMAFEEYHKALHDRVCSICRKSGYSTSCAIGECGLCPIDTHLPRLVNAVLSTPRSQYISDYVPNIREMVCSHCVRQDEKGVCEARNLAECGLDSFLTLIVETIEDVYDRQQGVGAH